MRLHVFMGAQRKWDIHTFTFHIRVGLELLAPKNNNRWQEIVKGVPDVFTATLDKLTIAIRDDRQSP